MTNSTPNWESGTSTGGERLTFKYLPQYAHFLLAHQLEAFSLALLRISREVNVPLLRYFEGMPEEKLIALSIQGTEELLEYFSQNKMQDFIDKSIKTWAENQLPLIQSSEVVVEDISTISFTRRKAFRDFLPLYSTDIPTYINIMEEVDKFTVTLEEICYKILFEMKQQKINEHHLYIDTINHQLQEAQEIAEMGSFEWDLIGNNSTFSPQLYKIFKMQDTTDLMSFLENVHPSDHIKVRSAIEKAIQGDGIYECEYRYGRGQQEKMIWSRGIVTFQEGKPYKMKGTVMDVTQRHHTLKRLERSEELHKQAQALTHLGNWNWFIDEDDITWSDELYRIFGLEPQSETITFERFIALVHPDDREKRQQEIQRALQTRHMDDYTMKILLDNGTIKILQGKGEVLVDEKNKPYKLIGTCQDITLQALLHEQLRENEETFRQLITNAPDAVIVINEDGHILLWNPKAQEIFGWTTEEVTGKSLERTIIPHNGRKQHWQELTPWHETGIVRVLNRNIEITACKKSGEEFYIALSIARSLRAGEPVFIFFIRDISKEKNAELELELQRNQLARKNMELEASNQELMAFNYIASHDLKEPVRKIKVFSSLIKERGGEALPENIKDYLERISSSAGHMQKLIDALFAFSRTTSAEKIFEHTDLNNLLAEVINSLKEVIEEKKAVIIASPLPVLPVIPFQFQQLLENILSNALKYSRSDIPPEIRITAKLVPGSTLAQPASYIANAYHAITISDNGIGFDQQYAQKIFELFQRLHGKHEYSGTGIGLAICKKIAQHHHGFIIASGEPGKGATFTVYMPA